MGGGLEDAGTEKRRGAPLVGDAVWDQAQILPDRTTGDGYSELAPLLVFAELWFFLVVGVLVKGCGVPRAGNIVGWPQSWRRGRYCGLVQVNCFTFVYLRLFWSSFPRYLL
jgi:hypothetical protein